MKNLPEIVVSLPNMTEQQLQENRNAVRSAFQAKQQAKIRIVVSVYGPPSGPEDKNSWGRYYGFLGMTPTVVCKTPEAVDHFLVKFRELMVELNGWSDMPEVKSA
jgi:hypothetical protein